MPKPREDETKEEFISRCISYMEENERDKFPSREQRIAVCYSYWENKDKEKESKKTSEKKPKSLMSHILDMIRLK